MIGIFFEDKLYRIFKKQNGYATTKELLNAGFTQYYIKKFVNEGYIERVKHGLYQHADVSLLPEEQLAEVSRLVPNGVICLLSAAAFHGLSTINPWQYHVAIHRNRKKPKLPSHPPIEVYYFNEAAFKNHVLEKKIEGQIVKIYNVEKTICDLVRYEETVGRDIMIECIKTYMRRPSRNLNKLTQIAKKQKVYNKISNFIEALL